jgi:uncharacterized repeat protein (TIGR03943 family)
VTKNLFSRWLPCATLAAWSAILLYFAKAPAGAGWKAIAVHTHLLSGRIDNFLAPAFRPWVLVAGLVLLAMALAFVFFPADAECCSTLECGHALSRYNAGKWLTFLVLIVPVSIAALYSPDSFGKNAMLNRGIITDGAALGVAPRGGPIAPPDLPLPTKDGSPAGNGSPAPMPTGSAAAAEPINDYLKRTPEGYIEAEVLDMLYAAQDATLRKDFEGKAVVLIAQLMPDSSNNPEGKRFKAVRMFMTCCAADARPVATLVEAEKLPDLPEMTWVKIIGKASFPIENGRRTSVINATSVTKVDPPAESMLY